MRHWPLSVVAESPLLHHMHTWELMCAYHTTRLSEGAMIACSDVTARTPAIEMPLATTHAVDAPMRRVYLSCPDPESFARLERAGFFVTEDTFGFMIGALH